MTDKSISILYVSYDGMLEPLGQSQVISYLRELSSDFEIHIMSFEKRRDRKDKAAMRAMRDRLSEYEISWTPLTYHKSPTALATTFDLAVAIGVGLFIKFRNKVQIVHARSYVPALVALVLKTIAGTKFIFDMRGFWADEKVDGGLWRRDGRLYKVAKWFERRFLLNADHIVSLTNVAVGQIHDLIHHAGKLPTITVIPTCTDLDRFRPHGDGKSGFVLGYVGSASTWHNFDAVAHCFSLLREFKPEATLMILNRGEHEYIEARLRSWDIPREAIELHTVRHDDVPAYISRMHAGIFFYKTCFSRLACAPTKLGEFLGCGVPCIGNRGVGDIADIIENEKVGIVVPGFETGSLTEGLGRLLTLLQDKDLEERCVATAWKYFSLGEGVERYKRIYSEMSDLQ